MRGDIENDEIGDSSDVWTRWSVHKPPRPPRAPNRVPRRERRTAPSNQQSQYTQTRAQMREERSFTVSADYCAHERHTHTRDTEQGEKQSASASGAEKSASIAALKARQCARAAPQAHSAGREVVHTARRSTLGWLCHVLRKKIGRTLASAARECANTAPAAMPLPTEAREGCSGLVGDACAHQLDGGVDGQRPPVTLSDGDANVWGRHKAEGLRCESGGQMDTPAPEQSRHSVTCAECRDCTGL